MLNQYVQKACTWKVFYQGKGTIQTVASWPKEGFNQPLDAKSQNISQNYREPDQVECVFSERRGVSKLGLHKTIDARRKEGVCDHNDPGTQ